MIKPEETKDNVLKRCRKCGKEYPPDHFSKNMSTEDHLERWCKDCKKNASADSRARKKKEIQKSTRSIRNGDGQRKVKMVHPIMPVDQDLRAITLPVEAIVAIEQAVAKKICAVIMEYFGSTT